MGKNNRKLEAIPKKSEEGQTWHVEYDKSGRPRPGTAKAKPHAVVYLS